MENVTKGLLIAAAILIAIILITIALKILNSTSGMQTKGVSVGDTISNNTKKASEIIVSQINSGEYKPSNTTNPINHTNIDKENYGDYIDLGKSVIGTDATSDDWRILYHDRTDNAIYAILADYLPNSHLCVENSGLEKQGEMFVYYSASRDGFFDILDNSNLWKDLIPNSLLQKGAEAKGTVSGEVLIASYNEKHEKDFVLPRIINNNFRRR